MIDFLMTVVELLFPFALLLAFVVIVILFEVPAALAISGVLFLFAFLMAMDII